MKRSTLLPPIMALAICATSAHAEVTVNGFASAGIGISSNDAGILGYGEDVETYPDSMAGVQFSFPINDHFDATAQLLARGRAIGDIDEWEPALEWAYLSYTSDDGNKIRAGRLRAPLYMYSDYLDVRYAHPTLRPSSEVYGLVGFTNYTGIDAIVSFASGDSTITVQPFFGATSYKTASGLGYDLNNFVGANAGWEWDSLLLRTVYVQGKFSSSGHPLSPLFDGKTGKFYGLGAKYDPGSFFVISEWGEVEIPGAFTDAQGAYITAGIRLGDFSPYVSLSMQESTDNEERVGIPPYASMTFERKGTSVGVRWDMMPAVALKLDVTYYSDFNGTSGFGPGVASPDGDGLPFDDATIVAIAIDAVF